MFLIHTPKTACEQRYICKFLVKIPYAPDKILFAVHLSDVRQAGNIHEQYFNMEGMQILDFFTP